MIIIIFYIYSFIYYYYLFYIGVENMLMHYIPEVTSIEEYLDEAGVS